MSNLSFVKHVGDGVTNTFLLAVGGDNIGYLDTRDIYVYVDGVEVTFSIQPASPHLAILDEAPADGSDVLIRRQVSKTDTYSDFSRGNVFSQKNMNNSFLQTLYLSQEWLDGFLPKGSYQKQDMDFGSKFAPTNLRAPVVPSDAVTKEYADEISDRVTEIESTVISGDTRFLSYTYKNGSADGGEIFLSVPYAFQSINRVYINGSNQTYGLAWDFDVNTQLIELAEELEAGDEVVIEIGFEPEKVLDNEIVSGASEIVATGTTTPRSLADRFADVVSLADETDLKSALVKVNSTGKLLLHNEASIQILVPSDLPTLQEAVDVGYSIYPKVPVEVMIESGHIPSTGILVEKGDYSNITLSSVDVEVAVSGSFSIVANYAKSVVLNTLFNLAASDAFDSYTCDNGSIGYVLSGAGMKNGDRGLYATNASTIAADGVIFTGFKQAGCHCSRSSEIQVTSANFSGNSTEGGTFGAVYASRNSRIHGQYMNVTGSGSSAIRAQRLAKIACPEVDVSGAAGAAFLATLGGEIFCDAGVATANNLLAEAIVCQDGRVIVNGNFVCSSSFSGTAIECRSGKVSWEGTISGYTGIIAYALEGGEIHARGSSITSGSVGLRAEQGGRINARSIVITSMTSTGAIADRCGFIEVNSASITGSTSNDLAVSNGSWISANGCSTTAGAGSPNVANTNLTGGFNFANNGNRGFIWT